MLALTHVADAEIQPVELDEVLYRMTGFEPAANPRNTLQSCHVLPLSLLY
jgi:hypothetical protein